jgi:hypothetical protein
VARVQLLVAGPELATRVLVTDDFSDPINGAVSDAQSSERYDVGLKEGELSIYKNDPSADEIYVVGLPGVSRIPRCPWTHT